jgi:hypothetical protein
MNSFYNIVKIARGQTSHDSIAIGLIAFSDDRYEILFSDRKIKIARTLLGDDSDLIEFFETQLINWIDSLNKSLGTSESLIFPEKTIGADYFDYLSRYSNNLIQFSKPFLLGKKINSSDFKELFSLLIDNENQIHPEKNVNYEDFTERIRTKLIEEVKDKVHVYAKLTEKEIPSLYFPFEMDCIGMNGVITAAKSIDFNLTEYSIDRNLSHYFQVSSLIVRSYGKAKVDNNLFLIADEPKAITSKEHQIWEKLKKQQQFVLINSEESGLVTSKINETKAHKFLNFEE